MRWASDLGKTLQAIGVICCAPVIHNVLIECPASLKINWRNELRRWLAREFEVTILEGTKPIPRLIEFIASRPVDVKVVIVNYDVLHGWAPELNKVHWDLRIRDEAHKLKNPEARRTIAAMAIRADYNIDITGTPIPNNVMEGYTLFADLDPVEFGNKRQFKNRYSYSKANLGELQQRLRSTIMIRRLKKDVLKELPAKLRQVIEMPVTAATSAALAAELAAAGVHDVQLQLLKAAVELAKVSESQEQYEAAVKALAEGARVAFTEMALVRHATAVAKLPDVIRHVETIVEEGHKCIIFAYHRDVMKAIYDHFSGFDSGAVDGALGTDDETGRQALALPMQLRGGEVGAGERAADGALEGLSRMPSEEARGGVLGPLSAMDPGQAASEALRLADRHSLDGPDGADSLPDSRHAAIDRDTPKERQQPVAGSAAAGAGVRQGQRVGHQLAGQRAQKQRHGGRAGARSGGASLIWGGMSGEAKQAVVDKFQNDESCRVFVGQYEAAGVGITLTAATYVVCAELEWVPGNMSQAEDRAHRIGQEERVLIQHLVLEGSLDATMARRLVDKQDTIDRTLDDPIEAPEAREPIVPASTSVSVTRKEVEEAPEVPEAMRAAIHLGLQMLAGMCDGARQLDGAGFSRYDSAIGKSLAESARLTNKQCVLGRKLVNRYRRQLPESLMGELCGN